MVATVPVDRRRHDQLGSTAELLAMLQAVLPEHDGPTAVVPVEMGDAGLEERDGIEAKTVVLQQLRAALDILRDHNPARISTLGGECSVSMAPFSYLINKYGDDMAILWIDSHPDMGTVRRLIRTQSGHIGAARQ
jgi:arginase